LVLVDDAFVTSSLREGEVVGTRGLRWYHWKERWWFANMLSVVTICSNVSDTQINRGGSLWEKIEEEVVDRCKPDYNAIWESHGAVVCERNRVDSTSSAVCAQCTNVAWRQTDKHSNRETEY